MPSALTGLGHFLPATVERGGVARPIAVDPVGPSVLAAHAARTALSRAQLEVADIDFLVFATMTPDVTFPGAGCFVQRELDAAPIGALDVRAQCAGFLYALAIADDFLTTDTYRRVLLLGGEVHSSALDYSERGIDVARLFGDGAAACVLESRPGDGGVRSVVLHCDGAQHDRFWCEYPASRQHPVRFTLDDFRAGKHFPTLDVDALRAAALAQLPAAIDEALAKAALERRDIDHFIVSHIVPEVAREAATAAGIDAERLTIPSERHGHLTAAALPVALSEACDAGLVGRGATVCLAAAGAGLCSGAAVLTL